MNPATRTEKHKQSLDAATKFATFHGSLNLRYKLLYLLILSGIVLLSNLLFACWFGDINNLDAICAGSFIVLSQSRVDFAHQHFTKNSKES